MHRRLQRNFTLLFCALLALRAVIVRTVLNTDYPCVRGVWQRFSITYVWLHGHMLTHFFNVPSGRATVLNI